MVSSDYRAAVARAEARAREFRRDHPRPPWKPVWRTTVSTTPNWNAMTSQDVDEALTATLRAVRGTFGQVADELRRGVLLPGVAKERVASAEAAWGKAWSRAVPAYRAAVAREHEAARGALAAANGRAETPGLMAAQQLALHALEGQDAKTLGEVTVDPTATASQRWAAGTRLAALPAREQVSAGGAALLALKGGGWRQVTEAQRTAAVALTAAEGRLSTLPEAANLGPHDLAQEAYRAVNVMAVAV